jgi:hypothetical protein
LRQDKFDQRNYTVAVSGETVNKSPSSPDGENMNISRILTELQAERERIEKAIAAIQALEKESAAAPSSAKTPGRKAAKAPARKRRLSAEGRKRIAEAARRRWAAVHKAAAKSAGKGKAA